MFTDSYSDLRSCDQGVQTVIGRSANSQETTNVPGKRRQNFSSTLLNVWGEAQRSLFHRNKAALLRLRRQPKAACLTTTKIKANHVELGRGLWAVRRDGCLRGAAFCAEAMKAGGRMEDPEEGLQRSPEVSAEKGAWGRSAAAGGPTALPLRHERSHAQESRRASWEVCV